MKVLITDRVDPVCIEQLETAGFEADVQLQKSPEALRALAAEADAWIIRSGTRITGELIEAAPRLKVIGRAGVGVDNVDLESATRRGVLVLNAPDGNTISTAEHTCAMILALMRQIPQANQSLRGGAWDRKRFTGAELNGKTLGVVGVGKIGRAVAERMRAFGLRVLGFDPVLGQEAAERIGVQLVSLDEIWAESDVITVHTPLNDATRGLLGRDVLARCKPGVRIVNCARGGIVDEAALLEALEQGHVGGAALDVYSQEPPPEAIARLLQHPAVVATPHIAASTAEAQAKVAEQVTEQVIRALRGEPVQTSVNALALRMAADPDAQPYLRLADKLGQIGGQLSDGPLRRVRVTCRGEGARRYAEVVALAAVRGVLSRWHDEPVNLVNAPVLAADAGLQIEERRDTESGHYTTLVEVALEGDGPARVVAGTVFNEDDLRLVHVDGYWLEVRPEGHLVFYRNVDRPGMLAAVGALLAEAGLNIGALALGRMGKGAMALTAISVDEPVTAEVRAQIAGLEGVEDVRLVSV